MAVRPYLVGEVMTPKPISIESGAQLTKAEHLMEEHNVRHFPVIEGAQLVGIISVRRR